jgi:hypothetical protein
MKTKSIILAALFGLAASARADEFSYSFSGVLDKRITSSGTDQLAGIDGPTDFTCSFTLNYLNNDGVYTLQGFSDITVSVADWLFTDNGAFSHYELSPNGPATDLSVWSDSAFTVRTNNGIIRAEGTDISLRGLAGTDPEHISGFTEGSVEVYGYCFDVQPCNYVLKGKLSPVADAGSVLPLLLVGLTTLFVSRRCLLR